MLDVRVDRIIEIEWAVRNHKAFVPSPKPARKSKARKTRTAGREHTTENETPMDVDQNVEQIVDRYRPEFGDELTNIGNAGKRHMDGLVGEVETPFKRQKLSAKVVAIESSDGEDNELVSRSPTKTEKRNFEMMVQCS